MVRACSFFSILATAYAIGPNLQQLKDAKTYQKSSSVTVVHGMGDIDFTLQYLTLRALADLPVALLEYSGRAYEARYYGQSDFKSLKPMLPFGRLPTLQHHGYLISQSSSIVRHIASETGLDGENKRDRIKIDVTFETIKELFGTHRNIKFNASALADVSRMHEFINSGVSVLHFRDTTNRGEYSEIMKSTVVLKTFNDMIKGNQHSKYLVGRTASYADIALFLQLEKAHETSLPNLFMILSAFGFQQLLEHYLEFLGHMNLSQYLSSDRRMPLIEFREDEYHYIFPNVPELTEDENKAEL